MGRISPHLLIGTALLLLTIAVSITADSPVRSLIPYSLAVAPVAWRHGIAFGFLFAGLATLAALASGAFPTRPEWSGEEVGEGLLTYAKLSAISVGVSLGRWVTMRQR